MRDRFIPSLVALALGVGTATAQDRKPLLIEPPPVRSMPVGFWPVARPLPELPAPPPPAPEPEPVAEVIEARPDLTASESFVRFERQDGSLERGYFDAEVLLWWLRSGPNPVPLVTTGPSVSQGIIGAPGTAVLFGGDRGFSDNPLPGLRLSGGTFFGPRRLIGIEASGFFLQPEETQYRGQAFPGGALLARPFVSTVAGSTALTIAAPDLATGGVAVNEQTWLRGAEVNGLATVHRSEGLRLNLIAGFRYLDLEEKLDVLQVSQIGPGQGVAFAGGTVNGPATIALADSFSTRTQFFGAQLGGRADFRQGRFFGQVTAKVALGNAHEVVDIAGATAAATLTGPLMQVPGGLFAGPTNIGRAVSDDFAVLPEAGVRIGWQVTRCISTFVGYDVLYLSKVVRPGDQIDSVVNPAGLPLSTAFGGPLVPARPAVLMSETDFWAQGLTFGVTCRY